MILRTLLILFALYGRLSALEPLVVRGSAIFYILKLLAPEEELVIHDRALQQQSLINADLI